MNDEFPDMPSLFRPPPVEIYTTPASQEMNPTRGGPSYFPSTLGAFQLFFLVSDIKCPRDQTGRSPLQQNINDLKLIYGPLSFSSMQPKFLCGYHTVASFKAYWLQSHAVSEC